MDGRDKLGVWVVLVTFLFNIYLYVFLSNQNLRGFEQYVNTIVTITGGSYFQSGSVLLFSFFAVMLLSYVFLINYGFSKYGPRRQSTADYLGYGLIGTMTIPLAVSVVYVGGFSVYGLSIGTIAVAIVLSTGLSIAYVMIVFILVSTTLAWENPTSSSNHRCKPRYISFLFNQSPVKRFKR